MPQQLPQIRKLTSPLVPPQGSRIVGQLDDGRAIYERTTAVVAKKPRLDAKGEQVYRRHPVTGEPVTPLFDQVRTYKTTRFVLHDLGNGNVVIVTNFEPSPEEKERRARLRRVEDFHAQFAEAAANRGLSADAVLDMLLQQEQQEGSDYPHHAGAGWWQLSDGSKIRGKKDEAVAAEAALHAE